MVNAVVDGVNMKWVAGQASYTPKHGTLGLVVRKELWDNGTIREIKDLKGKKISVPVLNGGGAIVMDKALNKVGLSNKDIQLSEMTIPNMPAALQNGALDAVMPAEPIVANMAAQGIGVILAYADVMYPGMEATQWMYSPQMVSQRPEVGVRFMTALLKGARRYNDAMLRNVNRQQVLDILIKNTSVKDAALYEKMQLSELNANGALNAANVQEQVDWLVQYGHVKARVDVSKLIDTTFTDKATALIGKV
jgi:NitT/TauT family transport system substrate-binding protein